MDLPPVPCRIVTVLCVDMTKGTEVPLSWRLVAERADGMGLARPTSTGSAGVRISSLVCQCTFGLAIVCWRALP